MPIPTKATREYGSLCLRKLLYYSLFINGQHVSDSSVRLIRLQPS
jgi:hypothetical protein